MRNIPKFWQRYAYRIGPHVFSLDDMEHGILRGNQRHPSTRQRLFSKEDPRGVFSVTELDPRIHCALVCGAKSCPPIRLYSAANLERGLTMACQNFCRNEVQVDPEARRVTVSQLFRWYSADFGATDADIVAWIADYLVGLLPVCKHPLWLPD